MKITFDPLWKTLIDRKMTKMQLVEKAKISKSTLAKLGKNEYVSLEVIERLCETLKCPIYDVVEIISEPASQEPASQSPTSHPGDVKKNQPLTKL